MRASGVNSLNYCRLVTRHHISMLPVFVIWPLSSVLACRSFGCCRCVSPCCMPRTFGLVESIGLVALAAFLLSLAAHPARSVSSIPRDPGKYSIHIPQIPMCFMTHSFSHLRPSQARYPFLERASFECILRERFTVDGNHLTSFLTYHHCACRLVIDGEVQCTAGV